MPMRKILQFVGKPDQLPSPRAISTGPHSPQAHNFSYSRKNIATAIVVP